MIILKLLLQLFCLLPINRDFCILLSNGNGTPLSYVNLFVDIYTCFQEQIMYVSQGLPVYFH